MFRCSLGVLLLFSPAAVQADWTPAPEPSTWQRLRRDHLQGQGWLFVEATETPQFEAAEYLRNPSAADGTVEVEAALLMRRAGQTSWNARLIPMRAVCDEGRLERRDPDGRWQRYPGRPGTLVKVRWICSLP